MKIKNKVATLPAGAYKQWVLKKLQKYDSTPTMLHPLILMAVKQHHAARNKLKTNQLLNNQELEQPAIKQLTQQLQTTHDKQQLIAAIEQLDITPANKHQYRPNGYGNYYDEKKENHTIKTDKKWNNKQRSVHSLLQQYTPSSLLDLGANTGWYSLLAAAYGCKNIVATDIDEYCMHQLHEQANNLKLPITTCVTDFTRMHAVDFKAEMTLCLATLHHFLFCTKLNIDEILVKLASMTTKVLVIEYIDLRDKTFKNFFAHPENYPPEIFQRALWVRDNYAATYYTIDYIEQALAKKFPVMHRQASHPEQTRTLLVFSK